MIAFTTAQPSLSSIVSSKLCRGSTARQREALSCKPSVGGADAAQFLMGLCQHRPLGDLAPSKPLGSCDLGVQRGPFSPPVLPIIPLCPASAQFQCDSLSAAGVAAAAGFAEICLQFAETDSVDQSGGRCCGPMGVSLRNVLPRQTDPVTQGRGKLLWSLMKTVMRSFQRKTPSMD